MRHPGSVAATATAAGEGLYRMVVPAKVAAQFGRGIVRPVASGVFRTAISGTEHPTRQAQAGSGRPANLRAGQLTARTAVLFVRSGSKSNGYVPNSPNAGWMLTAPVAPGTTVSMRTENANVRWVFSSTQYRRLQS